jgi:hypothetical protein
MKKTRSRKSRDTAPLKEQAPERIMFFERFKKTEYHLIFDLSGLQNGLLILASFIF